MILTGTTSTADLYYTDGMTSVRLDPDLEARLARAAALRGESKSEFIRLALIDRIDATLAASPAARAAHLVGAVDLGGGVADRAHEAAADLIGRGHGAATA
jgi:predicted transcriptional regulator